jgi:hypothetical protein
MQSQPIQPKLAISNPGDAFEQEADRVADHVMRMAATGIQRACAPCASGESTCPKAEEGSALIQRKAEGPSLDSSPDGFHHQLGSGHPLDTTTRSFFEPRFGRDFSLVRVHTDDKAIESARAANALAYTVGRDLVFRPGQYQPETPAGKRLLAHELTHVIQQGGTDRMIQRQHVPDTGFRYTPPAAVTRSIVEIQAVVGVNPDGVYGEDTRRAVEKYQTKLTAVGFYSAATDGRWGTDTEAAHVAFATAPNVKRKGYNCAGFAFKDYGFHSMATTKSRYAATTKLADCTKDCKPYQHKFWYWEFDINVSDTSTGATSATWRDFHTVGGQTDNAGKGPDQAMSKDGPRPVVGPKPPSSWKPVTEPVLDEDHNVVPNKQWNILSTDEECFCNDTLP